MTDQQAAGLLLLITTVSALVFMLGASAVVWMLRRTYRIRQEQALAQARLQMITQATLSRLYAAAREPSRESRERS